MKNFFDIHSISHFLSLFILFILIKSLFKSLSSIKILLIINILHIIEDILENTTSYGIESIIKRIDGPSDNDSLKNFIGDIVSGFLGSLLASFLI
jgi:hypothetical protein